VLAYAVRRTPDPQDAADVVAETFLVAWRRLDAVPSGEQARPWLYGVARHTLANRQRSELRRNRLRVGHPARPRALAIATPRAPLHQHAPRAGRHGAGDPIERF
jgi:RNA polymerase sigma-70 factor, ECF subfamily